MNFDFDDSQALYRATVERFCAPVDVAARLATRRLPGGMDRARWTELAGLGLIALAASEADGGLDGTLLDCAVVAETFGQRQAIDPWLECGFLPARLLAGTADLAGVIDGSTIAAFAFAEPNRRFRLDAEAVRASHGRLNGEKRLVLGGGVADLFIVTARDGDATRLFTVRRETPGVDVKPYPVADGSLAAVLTLREVAVGEPLPADPGRVVDDSRLMAAAEIVGLARRLFDDTLAYVKAREQFGQPIGRFQVIQHRLVDAYARVEQIQSSLYGALLQPAAPAAAVKAFIAEQALWVGEQAVQLHGGMGMTDELGIGHGLKRMLLLSKLFGDPASDIAAYARSDYARAA